MFRCGGNICFFVCEAIFLGWSELLAVVGRSGQAACVGISRLGLHRFCSWAQAEVPYGGTTNRGSGSILCPWLSMLVAEYQDECGHGEYSIGKIPPYFKVATIASRAFEGSPIALRRSCTYVWVHLFQAWYCGVVEVFDGYSPRKAAVISSWCRTATSNSTFKCSPHKEPPLHQINQAATYLYHTPVSPSLFLSLSFIHSALQVRSCQVRSEAVHCWGMSCGR
jgi:hypothetical protein